MKRLFPRTLPVALLCSVMPPFAPFCLVSAGAAEAKKPATAKPVVVPKPAAEPEPHTPKPAKADPAAYALLKGAHDSRQVLPENFPGFTADVTFTAGGKEHKGTLRYKRGEETQVKFIGLDKDTHGWVQDQLMSIIGHRRGGDFAKGDGRYPLTLGPNDGNEFGRLVKLNDPLKSSYRVRDNQVSEVTRTMGDTRFTISVIQTMKTDGGKYLPQHFIVSYRDAKTGALQEVQAFRDAYTQMEGFWLPLSRTVVTFDKETTPHMRALQFANVQLLPAVATAAAAPKAAPTKIGPPRTGDE